MTRENQTENAGAVRDFSHAWRALHHRNFRLFFGGQSISLIGTWMQNVAQAWLVYELTRSPFKLGVVSFCAGVPVLAFSLWAGVVADRMPKAIVEILEVIDAQEEQG